jgi:nucleoside-diphosphate-sugar epimerase
MRIVITGATGNVGTALLKQLVGSGEHELVGVVRRPPPPDAVYGEVTWHSVDLATSSAPRELARVFDGADTVVHLAWGFQPTRNTDYLRRVAVGGTTAVLDAAHGAEVGQLVHMSSAGAYAPGRYGERVDESWPTTGVQSSPYSRYKSAVEAALDDHQRRHGDRAIPITRLRPGFVVQRVAAGGLMRYALPPFVPMQLVRLLPLLPVDRRLCFPVVHADDVAAAVVRAVETQATGAFNLSADPPMSRDEIAKVMDARPVHVPSALLGAVVDLSWRARLQPVDRGWVDMIFAVPLLDCTRAQTELNWQPTWSSTEALADLFAGIADESHTSSAPLRPRSMVELLRRTVSDGLISNRRLP